MTSKHHLMTLQPDPIAYDALRSAQWTFGKPGGTEVYELRLNLATPAAITAEKANAPTVGLPSLDGFLSYVAFQAALKDALQANPELSKRLIWQWNIALRHSAMWIDFSLPLRTIRLQGLLPLFDCSIGLPVDKEGNILVPAGAFFIRNQKDCITYPDIVDSIALRRRVSKPLGRPIYLKSKELETGEGSTKALDNRLYFPLTSSYTFFFRGDKDGVERLLNFALQENIGLGKKTTLGYGRIASFDEIKQRSDIVATWAYPILDNSQLTLIKSLPYDCVFERREKTDIHNEKLFGCKKFALVAAIETVGNYRPPYWLREQRTQIVRYGSIIQNVK